MKKFLAAFICVLFLLVSLTGCSQSIKDMVFKDVPQSYQKEEYYDAQIKEIDAIIDDYTRKMEESKLTEIFQVHQECLDKIAAVPKKEEARANAIQNAADYMEALKGKLLPFQEVQPLILQFDSIDQDAMDDPAELNAVVEKLQPYIEAAAEPLVYHYDYDGYQFDVEGSFSTNAQGIPMITVKYSSPYNDLNFTHEGHFQLQFATLLNTDLSERDAKVLVPRMAAWNALLVAQKYKPYFANDLWEHSYDPAFARFTLVDEYTIQNQLLSETQWEDYNSDSETFINSDNEETVRDSGCQNPHNYVAVMAYGTYVPYDSSSQLIDNAIWLVLLK